MLYSIKKAETSGFFPLVMEGTATHHLMKASRNKKKGYIMLKAIKKDLMTMKGKIFGTYDVEPLKKDNNTIKFIDFLIENGAEVNLFGSRYNYEDFIFDDFKEDEIEETENGNSCNWGSPVVFQFRFFTYRGREYTAICFHRYGDVRANYTKYAVLNYNKGEFFDFVCNFQIEIPCEKWNITQDLLCETGYVRAWNGEDDFEGYYDEAPEEVKKAVEECLF